MTRTQRTTAASAEVDAYNAVFDELGLGWHWDQRVMQELSSITVESERIAEYLRRHHPHLMKAYPLDFLTSAIAQSKERFASAGRQAGAR